MSVEIILLIISCIGGIYSLIKIIYDMVKGKTFKEAIHTPECGILTISIIFTFILLFPWSKLHYGDMPAAKHDTIIVEKKSKLQHSAVIPIKDTTDTDELYKKIPKKSFKDRRTLLERTTAKNTRRIPQRL
ncbi:hypothetical protein [Mucilaginibacter pedocola]|uniref:Uncharacterized protein n=1 Tax=Mucilaginibacter pedocola TaxID=1792845 RepID=A0A1S9PM37_9SPHI|nr:hypothetical protein [Mucilaginibacter pedocola]OOQ62022.1 hypothetical protein BC343_02925 [Mucilaginibacter pedocola]